MTVFSGEVDGCKVLAKRCAAVALLLTSNSAAAAVGEAPLPLIPYPRSFSISDRALPPEGYRIVLNGDGRASVEAADESGRFYAKQTLRQLPDGCKNLVIEDWPTFRWRGIHLDESRHFFGKEVVIRLLDEMAKFKFNVLHWHLMDNQGNRFPFRKHERLATVGACRPRPDYSRWTYDREFGPYGPFVYTRDEIHDIVAYAKARHIDIVPEVEIPGHSLEVVKSYPSLFCGNETDYILACAYMNVKDPKYMNPTVLCLGNDETIRLLEDLLDEVCELFPDAKVIHIGGDECPRGNWMRCWKCQKRMRDLGLKAPGELQSWCTRHFVDYLSKKGRVAMGWDEILDEGDMPGAYVMRWHRKGEGVQSAQAGYMTVMTPHDYCYFDYSQRLDGDSCHYPGWSGAVLPLERVYSFDPYDGIDDEHRKYVLGGQANNWTERTPSESELQWKMWPRACAIAEVLWSGPGMHSYSDFTNRLHVVRRALIGDGVNAAPIK